MTDKKNNEKSTKQSYVDYGKYDPKKNFNVLNILSQGRKV